jgi:hypothetical protein
MNQLANPLKDLFEIRLYIQYMSYSFNCYLTHFIELTEFEDKTIKNKKYVTAPFNMFSRQAAAKQVFPKKCLESRNPSNMNVKSMSTTK